MCRYNYNPNVYMVDVNTTSIDIVVIPINVWGHLLMRTVADDFITVEKQTCELVCTNVCVGRCLYVLRLPSDACRLKSV